MPNENVDLEKIFCMMAKKYQIERALLMAICQVESAFKVDAYRYEPAFWEWLKEKYPGVWDHRDPKEVSASYGLMQVMYTTAWNLGFRGAGEELYEPVVNVELACRLINQIQAGIKPAAHFKCWPVEIVLARYNGGSMGNPDTGGGLRNYQYTRKVLKAYWEIRTNGFKPCTD